jgi:predicted RNA binding protein YcfA (HicA-like mRNA interferase family)
MMLPVIKGKELVTFLEKIGFTVIRQKGSHIRMKSEDGKYTTVPVHSGEDIPKGLLRKIIREDLEMELEDFSRAYENYKGHLSR